MKDPNIASLEYGEGKIKIKGLLCALVYIISFIHHRHKVAFLIFADEEMEPLGS